MEVFLKFFVAFRKLRGLIAIISKPKSDDIEKNSAYGLHPSSINQVLTERQTRLPVCIVFIPVILGITLYLWISIPW